MNGNHTNRASRAKFSWSLFANVKYREVRAFERSNLYGPYRRFGRRAVRNALDQRFDHDLLVSRQEFGCVFDGKALLGARRDGYRIAYLIGHIRAIASKSRQSKFPIKILDGRRFCRA